jgi:hypothetical protein
MFMQAPPLPFKHLSAAVETARENLVVGQV